MNGILTALLGGVAGAGQGVQYQDEKAMKLQAQKMERLSMAADMVKNGITPPKELLDGWDVGQPPAPPGAQPPAMPQAMPAPSAPPNVPQGLLTGLSQRRGDGVFPSQQAPQPSPVAPTQPGGMSGADAMRAAASGMPMPAPMNVGGLQVDLSRSLPYRTAMLGVTAEQMKDANKMTLDEQKIARDAQAILNAGQVNPNTGRPFTPAEATDIARNHDLALPRAPVLGTPAYSTAMRADRQQAAGIDVDKAKQMAPVTAETARQTIAATTPGEVSRAGQVAAATAQANPNSDQLTAASQLLPALAAKAYLDQFDSPAMATQIAQKYGSIGNYFDSKDGQKFRTAATAYISAYMEANGMGRMTSQQIKEVLPQFVTVGGDEQPVVEMKRQLRDFGVDAIRMRAGAALNRVPVPPAAYSPDNPYAPKGPPVLR